MKKLIILLILVCEGYYAQTLDKGKISFKFSGAGFNIGYINYEVPFTSVTLRKDDHFVVNARAEQNTEEKKIILNLELELYKAWNGSEKDKRLSDSLKLRNIEVPLSMSNVFDMQALNIETSIFSLMMLKDNVNKVGRYQNLQSKALGVPMDFATQKIICKVSDTSIRMEDKKYIIKGKFILMLLNDGTGGTNIFSEIKDGSFEIII